jgi:hypothetical protein
MRLQAASGRSRSKRDSTSCGRNEYIWLMPDGRRSRPPPWWWRTEVLVVLAAALAALLVTAYLTPPFP